MIRRLRRLVLGILPFSAAITVLLICYLIVDALARFVQGIAQQLNDPSIAEPFLRIRATVPTVAAIVIALYRIFAHHPIVQAEYRGWLERTPWTPRKRLPMGDVRPSWPDPVLVCFLCWLSSGGPFEATIAPVFGHVVAFLVGACVIIAMSRQRVVLMGLVFGVGLAIRLASDVVGPLVVLVSLLPLAVLGLRHSLDPRQWPALPAQIPKWLRTDQTKKAHLGWPFALIGPKASPRLLQRSDSVAISLLLGWYAYCGLSLLCPITREDERAVITMMCFAFLVGSAIRLVIYGLGHSPPITVTARIATGRLIISRYDQMFVSPLLTLTAVAMGEGVICVLRVPINYGQPIILALCVFLLTGLGPSLRAWELTGSHRITPTGHVSKAAGYLKV